jgi:Mrp family chromosome partitioning ATPase
MSRIFDALRKAEALRPPAATPAATPPSPALVPPAPAGAAAFPSPLSRPPATAAHGPRPIVPPLGIVPLRAAPELPEDVLREMGRLRVNLEAAIPDRKPRVVILEGPQGGEGTTTIATEFALALAHEEHLGVLLVDLHARRPALSADLATALPRSAARGHRRDTGRSAPAARDERLSVLPLAEESRSSGVITVQAVREVLDAAATGFDWVILDGPAVLETPEAAPLAALADGVVLVLHGGRTKRPVLSRSIDLLRKAGARVLGTVLNRRRLEIPGFIYRRI